MNFYFIADAHVCEQVYAHRPRIAGDSYEAQKKAVELVESGSTAIFCGDNFNSKRPSALDIRTMQDMVVRLAAKGCRVYAIQGNHDFGKVSWMEVCGAMPLARLEEAGTVIRGMDYCYGEYLERSLEACSKDACDILVMHGGFSFNDPFNAYSIDIESLPSSIRKGVVAGHIHKPEIRRNALGRQIVSVGASFPVRKGEPEGTIAVFSTETGEFRHLAITPYRTRVYHKVSSKETEEALFAMLDGISATEPLPIVYIDYLEDFAADTSRLFRYEDKVHLFFNYSEGPVLPDAAEDMVAKPYPEILKEELAENTPEYRLASAIVQGDESVIAREAEAFQLRLGDMQ